MKKIGLVLSVGGARGLAHEGVLRALEEFNISISAISGVSPGVLVGSLYGAGASPEQLKKILKNSDYQFKRL